MSKSIFISTLREIKQSLGRFLAILAIVALGVGFFAGLKCTQPDMLATMEKYFDETAFYDYRLISTLGYDEEAVEQISSTEGCRSAEGALSFDVMVTDAEGEMEILKAHSITENVNKIVLVDGRMPENDNECLVDMNYFGTRFIGTKLTLTDENPEDNLEHFSDREYTIVGRCKSPLYVQYERGNTSLGDGVIDGFMYVSRTAFTDEFYTEVYVKLVEDEALYSEAAKALYEKYDSSYETSAKAAAFDRYDRIVEEANVELSDARTELNDKKAEAEQELADAKIELDDGAAELADAKQKLDDARTEIEDGERELADAKRQLDDAKVELDAALMILDSTKIMYESHEAEDQIRDAAGAVAQAGAQLEASKAQLDALGAVLASGMLPPAMVPAYTAQYNSGMAAYNGGMEAYGQARAEVADAAGKYYSGYEQIQAGQEAYANGMAEYEAGLKEYDDAVNKLEDGRREYEDGLAEYEDGLAEYEDGLAEYEDALAEFNEEIADAQLKLDDAQAEIDDIDEPESYVLGRNTNIGYVCFESDSGIVDGIAGVFPVFFFLVAALVCVTTMNRMVEEQRTQIGVLKALGYGEATIMSKYMVYSGSAAVIGAVAGFAGGTVLFPMAIWYAYGMMYNVGGFEYVFNLPAAIISIAVALLCSIGTTYLSCRVQLSEMAAELMRPKAPKPGKRIFLEYIPFIWNRLSFLRKVSMRNIFRYQKRFFMMVFGISGCTALLIAGFGVKDSVTNIANMQYEDIELYDVGLTLTDSSSDEIEAMTEIGYTQDDYLLFYQTSVDMIAKGGTKSIYAMAFDDDENLDGYLSLHSESGEAFSMPKPGEGIINKKMAMLYDIKVGDEILIRDGDMNEMPLTIVGINENFIYNYVYICSSTFEEAAGKKPEKKTVYLNIHEGDDVHEIAAKLMDTGDVAAVSINADLLERVNSMMESMNIIVLLVIISGAGLAFVVLYNLTNINITERIREIATIKVLGFFKRESEQYVFRENLILAFIGACVGLGLGKLLHMFIMKNLIIDLVFFNPRVSWLSYLYSFGFTMIFALFVNIAMGPKLDKVSMTESLKSVD